MRHWFVLILFLLGLGVLRVTACGDEGATCHEDEDCYDGNPCTFDYCEKGYYCDSPWPCRSDYVPDGEPCDGGTCQSGECVRDSP